MRETVFRLCHCLSKHKMIRYAKNLEGIAPLGQDFLQSCHCPVQSQTLPLKSLAYSIARIKSF